MTASAWLLPDPADPANDQWWRLHDRLDAIAVAAATLNGAATAARTRLCSGQDPLLTELTGLLHWWMWDDTALDVAAEQAMATEMI